MSWVSSGAIPFPMCSGLGLVLKCFKKIEEENRDFVKFSFLLIANKTRTKGALQDSFLLQPGVCHIQSQPTALLI